MPRQFRSTHTALHIAISKGRRDINYNVLVKTLITLGANIHAVFHGYDGAPIEAAAIFKNKVVRDMLKYNSADQGTTHHFSFQKMTKDRCTIL